MSHYVDIRRSRYLGNRDSIELWHRDLSIGVCQEALYDPDGRGPRGYRYWIEDRQHAMLFKLTWG